MFASWVRSTCTIGMFAVLLLVGCMVGSPAPLNAQLPALQIDSGNDQTAEVGTALAQPLVVVVRDALQNPVAGVAVTFEITAGGGTLAATSATTDALGQAQTALTLGAAAGANTVTATSAQATGSVTFTATGTAPVANVLFSTHVKPILDANCVSCHRTGGSAAFAPLTSYALVRFGMSAAGDKALVVAGNATSSVLAQKILPAGSMYSSLGADATTRDANAKTINDWIAQGALNTAVGAASQVTIVSGNNQSATISTALPAPFVVRVTDANDNPVADVSVSFAVTAGGGTLSASTAKTDAMGQARTTLSVGAMTGANSVSASVTGITPTVTFAATGTTGSATQIALVSGNNQSATVGAALAAPLVVAVKDAGGNPVSGFMVSFAVATGTGTLSAATVVTNASGQAQTALTLGTAAGMRTVTANATGLTGSPVTFTATGTAGAATQISVASGNNQSAPVTTALPMPLTAAVKDASGNPVAGVAVTFAVATGGGSLSATSATTDAMGEAKSTLTLGAAAGSNTVTARATGITGTVTFTESARWLTYETDVKPLLVGKCVSCHMAGGSAAFTPLTSYTEVRYGVSFGTSAALVVPGNATTSVLVQKTQSTGTMYSSLGADATTRDANAKLVRDWVTQGAFNTTEVGPATQLALVSGNGQTATVGSALAMPLVVKALDANMNPVAGVSVTFAVTSGGGTLTTTTATTSSLGSAQTTLTVGTTAGSNVVTASATGLGSVMFTATGTAGAATQLVLVSGNNQSTRVGTALANPLVVAARDANGNAVSGVSITFAVASGGGSVSATTAMTNAMGQAQTALTVGTTAGTNTVTATRIGLTGSPITFTATGVSAAPTQVALVSGNNQTARTGGALAMPFVVVVRDASGNPVSNVAVAFAVTGGGGSLSATSATTNTMGQAQSTLTVGATPGTNTATATVTGLTAVTFTATARRVTYEDDVQPILVARCVSCHMSGGQASFTPLTTFTQVRYGVSFFSSAALVVPGSPGSSLLVGKTQSAGSMYASLGADTATRDTNAKIISDWVAQGSFNSAVGPATQIVIASGNNQSAPANTTLTSPLVVSVMDAKLNPVSGFTVSFTATSGGGTVTPASVATNAQGTAATSLKLGTAAGTNTVTANATGLTGSPVTFTATATAGAYSGAPLAGSTNPFDVAGLVALRAANVEPAALSSDGEFLRRVTADLAGRLPTLDEWTTFAASTDPAKRDLAIDRLLASAEFGTHWGLDILAAWLAVEEDSDNATNVINLENYLIDAATTDKPMATVLSELAQGMGAGGIAFDSINMVDNERYMAADRLMETFTGVPSKCARCHDSLITGPNDDPKWTMAQNRGLYKFFEVESGEFTYYDTVQKKYVNPTMMFVVDGAATNPTNLPAPTDTLAVRRARFAQLLSASNAFKRGMGHRIFAEVMQPLLDSNRFLAQHIADVKVPAVLDASTSVFNSQGTSLKGYLRTLMRSRLYQLTTKGTSTANDGILARHKLRRHAAEVLQAGIVAVTGIADSTSARNDFLSKFGYAMERATITERSFAINTIQPLTLLNNTVSVAGKVTQSTGIIVGLATKVDGGTMTLDAAITEIFRRALTRDPTATELTNLKSELTAVTTTREKLEDIAAVVLASIEFVSR